MFDKIMKRNHIEALDGRYIGNIPEMNVLQMKDISGKCDSLRVEIDPMDVGSSFLQKQQHLAHAKADI